MIQHVRAASRAGKQQERTAAFVLTVLSLCRIISDCLTNTISRDSRRQWARSRASGIRPLSPRSAPDRLPSSAGVLFLSTMQSYDGFGLIPNFFVKNHPGCCDSKKILRQNRIIDPNPVAKRILFPPYRYSLSINGLPLLRPQRVRLPADAG